MDSPNQSRHALIRAGLSLAAVFILLHLADRSDVLSDLTRPAVTIILKLIGVAASDHGGFLKVGRLEIPWSRDCAGLNIFAILLALSIWTGRHEALSRRYWLRLALALPISIVANIARILTLIAYRHGVYPAVESPQLHYFIGFLWVMPFLGWFIPRSGRPFRLYVLESLYLAAALSLVAPLVHAPGGSLVTLATLVVLAQTRFRCIESAAGWAGFAAWLISGLGIALASMESLWIPWLLLSPNFVAPRTVKSLTGPVLIAGTIPLVAMQPVVGMIVGAALVACGWQLWREHAQSQVLPMVRLPPLVRLSGSFSVLLGVAFLAPFLASSLSAWQHEMASPPSVGMSRQMDLNTYQVRLVGQSPDIELTWHGPQGGGRHHSLPVCMRFRSVELVPSGDDPAVMTDGRRWMREFFLHHGTLLTTYGEYLKQTFAPWSSAGVHIIAVAPAESMTAASFAQNSKRLAEALARPPR